MRRASLVVPGKFKLATSALTLTDGTGNTITPVKEVDLLCGVGSPFRVLRAVEKSGTTVVGKRIKGDHDPLSAQDLLNGMGEERPLLVTSKDWVKLKLRDDLGKRVILVADYQVTLQPEAEFAAWIGEKLIECMDSSSR